MPFGSNLRIDFFKIMVYNNRQGRKTSLPNITARGAAG